MKIAKIIPIFKNGQKTEFTNYRPISILSQFSKILEKLFNLRLEQFLDANKMLSDSQYGFRPGMSTVHAAAEHVEQISSAIDGQSCCAGVFIDLKKAFDTVDHSSAHVADYAHISRLIYILTIHARDVHNTIITYTTESKQPPMNHHEY